MVACCLCFFVYYCGLTFVVALVDGYWMLVLLCLVFMACGCFLAVDLFGCCCCFSLGWVFCC